MCPHYSDYYVYESHFSHLLHAVYVLGHFAEILKQISMDIVKESGKTDLASWKLNPKWKQVFVNSKAAMESIWLYLEKDNYLL